MFETLPSIFGRLKDIFGYPDDPECAARVQQEQFAALRRTTPGMMAANIGNACALFATLLDTPLAARAAVWAGATIAVCAYLFIRARRPGARRQMGQVTRIGRRAVANALVLGVLWAAPPLLFFPEAGPGARLMIVALTSGMLFGGAFALARAPLAAIVFALPIAAASAIPLLAGGDRDLARVAIVLCIYVAALCRSVCVEAVSFKARVLAQMAAERQARTDALTGLPNRLAFVDAIERELARMRRHGGSFLLLCVDLDNFKMINDCHGHQAGDELLTQAAQRMRACLRGSDFVGRLGGDEFAVIAAEVSTSDTAQVLCKRLVGCFEAPFLLEGCMVNCRGSVGGALGPRHGGNQRELFKSADVALYQAKQQGGGWRLFDPAGTRREPAGPMAAPLAPRKMGA